MKVFVWHYTYHLFTRRIFCMLLVAILLLPLLIQLAEAEDIEKNGAEVEPIKIAAIFSKTGLAARNNKQVLDIIVASVDRVNINGGVLGRPLELLVYDNKSTPVGSLEAAHKAVAAGVSAVIGAHWSSHSLAMAPYLQDAGVPMITPTSTNVEVTQDKDYVFRVCYVDTLQGKAMARFAVEQLQVESVGILFNIDEEYSIDLANFFRTEMLLQNRKVLLNKGYRGAATDFSRIISELISENPDAVYIPGYTRDSALFIKQARQQGLKSIFLGGDGWDLIEKLIDKEVEGSYQTVLWHPDMPYTETQTAIDLMHATQENLAWNLGAPLGYDAVMILVDAIERAGTTEKTKIRDALAMTKGFPGVAGPVTFDAEGNPIDKSIVIVKFEQAKMKYTAMVKLR